MSWTSWDLLFCTKASKQHRKRIRMSGKEDEVEEFEQQKAQNLANKESKRKKLNCYSLFIGLSIRSSFRLFFHNEKENFSRSSSSSSSWRKTRQTSIRSKLFLFSSFLRLPFYCLFCFRWNLFLFWILRRAKVSLLSSSCQIWWVLRVEEMKFWWAFSELFHLK